MTNHQEKRIRLGVWAGDGNNTHFLDPILEKLPSRFKVQKFTWDPDVPADVIRRQMDRVDVVWFEWGIGPVVPGSRLTASKPTVCRIHRYEVYTPVPRQIHWQNVDCLAMISDYVRRSYAEMHDGLPATRIEVVPNAVAVENYPYDPKRERNFNIGFLGRLHYVKNPMLLVHILKKLVDVDPNYQLHIAGPVQQMEIAQYLLYQAEQMGISDHIHTYGKIGKEDVRSFLAQCSFILSTSVIEGHPVGIMEAMASGCKPVIHDFPGAREIFNADFLFNTVDQAADLILNGSFEPRRYRAFIAEKYDQKLQLERYATILDEVAAKYDVQRAAAAS